jgi:hypothetical protein
MELLIKIAKDLNILLKKKVMNEIRLEKICQTLGEQTRVRFKLMDFEFFNEERMDLLVAEKNRFLKDKNYEAAANLKDVEKNFEKHIRFRIFFGVRKSGFYSEDNHLVYLHTGKARNDRVIYDRLTSPVKGFFKNPNSDATLDTEIQN